MSDPWRDAPTLAGAHVTLRPLVRDDGPALVEAARDGEQWSLFYTMVPGPETVDGWMDQAFREVEWGRSLPFAVLDATGAVAGTTRYMRMSRANRRVEIGSTFYARRVQRTGLNTEAKRLLLGHAFDALGCVCVQFCTDWFNQRSRRAIERLGARQDGVLRGQRVMADGRVRDTVVYSILDHEWPAVRRHLDGLMARGGSR